MNRHCRACGAPLGPRESSRCVSCRKQPPTDNADVVVAVLERSQVPLAPWDIERHARTEFARDVWLDGLGWDPRLCYAGRSLWGLYRHGLLPGVRTLSKAAAIYVHAAGAIRTKELYFVMRRVGYRFSHNSLAMLSYEPWVERIGWQNLPRGTKSVQSQMSRQLGLARGITLRDVLQRAEAQIAHELAVFTQRAG
jgi:hypothetical protein